MGWVWDAPASQQATGVCSGGQQAAAQDEPRLIFLQRSTNLCSVQLLPFPSSHMTTIKSPANLNPVSTYRRHT